MAYGDGKKSNKSTSYGNGSKTNSYNTSMGSRKNDTYSGGQGRPDGPGHGHRVTTGSGFTTYSRKPNPSGPRPKGWSLGELLFGTSKPSGKKRK